MLFPPLRPFLGALRNRLTTATDGSSVALFRVAFGAVILYEAIENVRRGWISEFWVNPLVRFSYLGFDWVKPLPEPWLIALNYAMAAGAILMIVGLFYRLAAVTVFLIFTYQFLLEATRYLNHFYAACLFGLLLCFVPAANTWSIDSALKRTRARSVPVWAVWILRFQVGVLYLYGGFAKLQPDWIAGQPIVSWMERRAHLPVVAFLLDRGWEVAFFAWGGLLFDLLVVPALLWHRTRYVAFAIAVIFHLLNSYLFHIGIFPWMMIPLTTIFLPSDWPRRLIAWIPLTHRARSVRLESATRPLRPAAFAMLTAFVSFQLLFPARAALYPGNVLWTEEAATFSWRMMLREKKGEARMIVASDRAVDTLQFDTFLRYWQVQPVTTRPFLTLQFAHFLADYYRGQGHTNVRVYAESRVSLNGREAQYLIDPSVDLAAEPLTPWPASWITPLNSSIGSALTASDSRLPPTPDA